ncbi:hypothetical protein Pan216_08580 [Planctomycetes bacterium Pan216]|uniref:Uncharacterized protein n=1 Tax=Kolteria novifilia TaxID=2527975 RepID=A0A518AZ60_9BACT|nr:hypothetical protein Pan216_08580 [Planctomycetes bacterium Pan216]
MQRETETQSWKSEILNAGLKQGPAFILLLLLLYGLWEFGTYVASVGVPAHLEQIKVGYLEIQQSHSENLERLLTSFEREQERYRGVIDLLGSLVESRELIESNHSLLLQVIEELKLIREAPEPRRKPHAPS